MYSYTMSRRYNSCSIVSRIRNPTLNFLTAIGYGQKIDRSLRILVVAVVFTNIGKLPVPVGAWQPMAVPSDFTVLPFSSRIRNQVILKIYVLILWPNMACINFYSLHHLFSYHAKLVLFYYLLVHTQVISAPKFVSHFGRAITNP